MTKSEIMEKLDALGIEYPKKATLAQLEALLPSEEPEAPQEEPEAPEEPEEAHGEPVELDEPEASNEVPVKVLARFRDRVTLEIREVGDVVTMTPERVSEVLAAGRYISVI